MRRSLEIQTALCTLALAAAGVAGIGCGRIPGKPGPGPEVARPENVLDFPTLYQQNCAACHGDKGAGGAAISLANPVYIAIAGQDRLQAVIANGVPGKLMPPFAKSAGGMLTDAQVAALAQGMVKQWANPAILGGQTPPLYQSTLPANAAHGLEAYQTYCARCHGATGEGSSAANSANSKLGSIVDPSYLALVSDQYLRSILIAGRPDSASGPDQAMPDWRGNAAQTATAPQRPMTDQQVTDIVAWLASKRSPSPGQPYPAKP